MPHITFIHGIANKPPRENLQRIWENALARDNGIDLNDSGVTTNMVYWADCFYEEPMAEEAYESAASLRNGEKVIEDIIEQNCGKWRHDITKYLAGRTLRSKLQELLGL